MDYKEQTSYLRYLAQQSQQIEAAAFIRAAESITDMLDSVEAAKVRCETLEKMVKEYQEELIPGYRERAEKSENMASDLCDDFTDFVTGGVHNAAPYCANCRLECVNARGWCNGDNKVCRGFLPKSAVWKEETRNENKFGVRLDVTPYDFSSIMEGANSMLSFHEKVAVEFIKQEEQFLISAIIQRARENGITKLWILNEDFIMDAILEKAGVKRREDLLSKSNLLHQEPQYHLPTICCPQGGPGDPGPVLPEHQSWLMQRFTREG